MADVPHRPEDDEVDDFDAALKLGHKVLEMCDRLRPIATITPGAAATYGMELDGVHYQVRISIADQVVS